MSRETITEPARSTPVYGEFDVVVVGGGPAGIMAASSAARAGCSTLLIERYGFLGGAGTAGGLSTFCGLHARTYGADVRVIRGLADDLLSRLVKLDGLNEPHLTIADGIAAQAFDISAYKIAADELVTGSGARILFHAIAVGVVMKNPEIPFRIILPGTRGDGQRVGNLYVTGRCASMTHGAQSAARVTGPCFAMGEAAGVAASMALSAGAAGDGIDVPELQRRLEDQGAYLGRAAPEAIL